MRNKRDIETTLFQFENSEPQTEEHLFVSVFSGKSAGDYRRCLNIVPWAIYLLDVTAVTFLV